MVDVGGKPDTERRAVADGEVILSPQCFMLVTTGNMKKGDVLAVARLAGIMAAKKTAEIIPLAHPLPLTAVSVDLLLKEPDTIQITAVAKVTGKTGVEMEALTAVSVAALTVYDMCKAVDKTIRITNIRLREKSGGKSGLFSRADTTLT